MTRNRNQNRKQQREVKGPDLIAWCVTERVERSFWTPHRRGMARSPERRGHEPCNSTWCRSMAASFCCRRRLTRIRRRGRKPPSSSARRKTMTQREVYSHRIDWNGITVEVTHEPNWLNTSDVGYATAHIQLCGVAPERAPLPMTETGYRSHFLPAEEVTEAGGPIAYARAWLDGEAIIQSVEGRSGGYAATGAAMKATPGGLLAGRFAATRYDASVRAPISASRLSSEASACAALGGAKSGSGAEPPTDPHRRDSLPRSLPRPSIPVRVSHRRRNVADRVPHRPLPTAAWRTV